MVGTTQAEVETEIEEEEHESSGIRGRAAFFAVAFQLENLQ
jgi:hypothetical protein